ncbi:MAG: DUF1349 domain-containing protein [Alphaproteobacteria bacterium]|nr:DUF1349 domain-containing protein [Alphaproteobacteria bacterium]MBQ9235635.1 DUF1349 domain-containing protein [Alphaproteobacteria bacterium]
MILENIRRFDWQNEPQNVSFTESGLQITAAPYTDFWQNIDNHFSKDDGHFFRCRTEGNFIIKARWFFESIRDSAQCGLMLRFDERNWLKSGLLSPNIYRPQIGVIAANHGSCDWSIVNLPDDTHTLWLKVKKCASDFVSYYSLDGQTYQVIRMTHLPFISSSINAGAYVCSPKDTPFECILEELDLQKL